MLSERPTGTGDANAARSTFNFFFIRNSSFTAIIRLDRQGVYEKSELHLDPGSHYQVRLRRFQPVTCSDFYRAVDDKIAKDLLGDAFRMQLMSAYRS